MTSLSLIIVILMITTICSGQIQYQKSIWLPHTTYGCPLPGIGVYTSIIQFALPFEEIPKIILTIQNIDADYNAGFEVYSQDITIKSFTLNLDIQSSSLIYQIKIFWFAMVHPLLFLNSYRFNNLIFPPSTDPISSIDFILNIQKTDKFISFINGFHFTTTNNYLQLQVTSWEQEQIKLTIFSLQATTLDLITCQIVSLNENFSFDTYQEIYQPVSPDSFYSRIIIPTNSQHNYYIDLPKQFDTDQQILKIIGLNGISWNNNLRLSCSISSSVGSTYFTQNLQTWADTTFTLIHINYMFFQFTNAYQLSQYNGIYYPICGDGIKTYYEQCDEELLNINNCFYCKLQCDPTGCLKCLQNICYQCKENFKLNGSQCIFEYQQIQLFPNQYQEQEQYQALCQDQCEFCVSGKCLKCKLGWQLILNKCIDIVCGDSLVTQYYEECDDANSNPYDGCYQCKYQCDFNCLLCTNGICNQCEYGWYLDDLNSCYSQCGDGQVAQNFEQCDDGNDIQYDGCYNCEYQCHQTCQLCVNGICQECQYGYYLDQSTQSKTCESKCGDMIVILEQEECDDGNNDANDGCDNCKLTQICDLNICDICLGNECIFCDFGYYPIDSQCQPKCGDAIFIPQIEECEDGNKINGDGCSATCLIEEGYICFQSMCTKYDQPYMYLEKQSINQNQSLVKVKFTQQVKIQQKSDETFQLALINIDESIYSYQSIIIQVVTNQLNNIEYQFLITFNQICVNPKAQVTCYMNLTNIYDQNVQNNQSYILLDSPQFFSDLEQQILQYSFNVGKYEVYCLLSISGLSLIMQNFGILMNCLDLLQQLSYLKYINFVFPENLESFFDCFDMVQLQYYLDQYISQLSINLNLELNYLQIGKFLHYQVQSCIFYNLFSIFALYLFSLLVCLIFRIIFQQFEKINEKHFKLMSVRIFKIFLFLRKLIYNLSSTSELGFYVFLYANAYEILFASFVQTLDRNTDLITILGITCSLVILLKYLHYILIKFKKINPKYPENQVFCFGIKSNGSYWQLQTNNLALLQKLLFMQAITLCQDEGVIAILEIFIIQFGFIAFLIYQNSFKLIYDSIMTKVFIFISSMSIIFYSINWRDLNQQQRVIFGWISIFSILLAMTFQIIVSLLQLISKLRQWIAKQVHLINMKKEEKRQQQQHILFS